MSASTAGAIKAKLEGAGTGIAWFRDEAPAGTLLPYGTISEGISIVPEGAFNSLDDATGHVSELAQVDIWQQWRNPSTRALTESYTLPGAVIRALHGTRLPAAPKLVFECSVLSAVRLPERNPDNNIIHHAVTVQLRRLM